MNVEKDESQIISVITILLMATIVSYFSYFSYSNEEKEDFQGQDKYNIPTAILRDRITHWFIH